MRGLLLRGICVAVNFLLGDTRSSVSTAQERKLALARSGDPYFLAFHARCMQWVYDDDPRRALERERLSAG